MINYQKVFSSPGKRIVLILVSNILLLLSVRLSRADEPNSWTDIEKPNNPPVVEINSNDDHHNWVEVKPLGTLGLISGGQVNRGGIGAVVKFTPKNGLSVRQSILAGSDDVVQDSLEAHFDLGSADRGTVEVLWPSGVRNRLHDAHHAEQILFPEIPCNFAGKWASAQRYHLCVHDALEELETIGLVRPAQFNRFLASALKAYREEQGLDVNYGAWSDESARSREQTPEVTFSTLCWTQFNPMGIVADHPAYLSSNDGAYC